MHNIAIHNPDNFSQQVMNFFLRSNKYAFIPGILFVLLSIAGANVMEFPKPLYKAIFLIIPLGIFAFGCWLFSGYRYHAQKPAITKWRLLLWLGTILLNGLLAFIVYLADMLPLLLPILMWTVSVSFLAICACINDLYTLWQAKQNTESSSR